MVNIGALKSPFTADATGASAIKIGNAGESEVSTWVVHVYIAAGVLTALKFVGVLQGSGLAVATYGTPLCYTNRTSGALVAGGTGITASGIYEVNAAGLDVYLDIDVGAAGNIEIYVQPVSG